MAKKKGYKYWLSNVTVGVVRGQFPYLEEHIARKKALYVHEEGKRCPTGILKTLASYNVEGRPIWKPMHMQPITA